MKKLVLIILIIVLIFQIIFTTMSFAYEEKYEKNIENATKNEQIENINSSNDVNNNQQTNTNSNSINSKNNTINVNNNTSNNMSTNSAISNKSTNDEKQNNEPKNNIIENEEQVEETKIQANSLETEKSIVLEDGLYYIKSKLNEKMVFDVAENSKDNYAKIQLWEKSAESTANQKFKVTSIGNGYYKIEAKHSGKVLDVPGAAKSNCTKIQQYDWNETDAQQWIIKDAGDGYCYIVSKCNGLYLDVYGAMANNGTLMQIYEGNGSNAQKFKLEKIEKEVGSQTIEDGTYYISSKLNNNMVFDITGASLNNSARLQIWEKSLELTNNQKFEIIYLNNGYYKLIAKHSEKALDVPGASTSNGTKIQQYNLNETDAQQWIIKDAGDGYYYIISKCNDLYLDIAGAIANNGVQVQIYEGNGSNAQKFKFEKVEEIVGEQTITDGTYKIKVANTNMIFDIDGISRDNGAIAQIWEESSLLMKNQRFEIKYIGNGYYNIIAKHSGKALRISGNRVNIEQEDLGKSNAQKWIIKDNKDGTYSFINKADGLYVEIQNQDIKNGSKVIVNKKDNNSTQKFKLEKVENEKSEQTIKNGVYQIVSGVNNGKVLDIVNGSYNDGANLQIWENSGSQQQKFEIIYKEDGYYEIKNTNSGKNLEALDIANKNSANVHQNSNNDKNNQKWIIKNAGDGYFYIISKSAEAYLDIAGGSQANGTNVRVYDGNGSYGQKFKFSEIPIIASNKYNICTAIDNNKVIDMDVSSKKIQMWELNKASENQKFDIIHIENGEYKVICKFNQQVLTAKNKSVTLSQYNAKDENQRWIIETAQNGYFYMQSKSTGLYLDIAGGSSNNGTPIQLYEKNSSKAQLFKFQEITILYGIDVSSHNGLINWLEVKQSNNVSYAMIRAAYRGFVTGQIVTDEQFARNLMQASSVGLDIGVYFFTQATNEQEAIEEADYIVNLIRSYNVKVKYPIVIDTENSGSKTNGKIDNEGRADQLSSAMRTNVCIAFCERVKQYGYTPMIYASRDWFYNNLEVNRLIQYEHWVAHYTKDVNISTNYQYPYTMWQYTSEGKIRGISGNVDMNVGYKTY